MFFIVLFIFLVYCFFYNFWLDFFDVKWLLIFNIFFGKLLVYCGFIVYSFYWSFSWNLFLIDKFFIEKGLRFVLFFEVVCLFFWFLWFWYVCFLYIVIFCIIEVLNLCKFFYFSLVIMCVYFVCLVIRRDVVVVVRG